MHFVRMGTRDGVGMCVQVTHEEFDLIARDRKRSLRLRCKQDHFDRLQQYAESRRPMTIYIGDSGPTSEAQHRMMSRSVRDVIVFDAAERDVVIVLDSFDSDSINELMHEAEYMRSRIRDLTNAVSALTYTNNGLVARVADLEPRALDEQSSFLAWACAALVQMHLPYDPIARVLRGDLAGLESVHEGTAEDITRFFANAPAPYAGHAADALARFQDARAERELARQRAETMTTFAIGEGAEVRQLAPVHVQDDRHAWVRIVPSLEAAMDVVLIDGLDAKQIRFVRATRPALCEGLQLADALAALGPTSAVLKEPSIARMIAAAQQQIDAIVRDHNALLQRLDLWSIDFEHEIDIAPATLHDALRSATERREALAEQKAQGLSITTEPVVMEWPEPAVCVPSGGPVPPPPRLRIDGVQTFTRGSGMPAPHTTKKGPSNAG